MSTGAESACCSPHGPGVSGRDSRHAAARAASVCTPDTEKMGWTGTVGEGAEEERWPRAAEPRVRQTAFGTGAQGSRAHAQGVHGDLRLRLSGRNREVPAKGAGTGRRRVQQCRALVPLFSLDLRFAATALLEQSRGAHSARQGPGGGGQRSPATARQVTSSATGAH